jgi:hypothetical protein
MVVGCSGVYFFFQMPRQMRARTPQKIPIRLLSIRDPNDLERRQASNEELGLAVTGADRLSSAAIAKQFAGSHPVIRVRINKSDALTSSENVPMQRHPSSIVYVVVQFQLSSSE